MSIHVKELIGSFIFVFITVGIDVIAPKGAGLLGIGASFGLTYAMLYYSVNQRSGCHLNPVLSLAELSAGRIGRAEFLSGVLAQFVGSFLAVQVVYLIMQGLPAEYDLKNLGFAHNGWGKNYVDEYNIVSAGLVELTGSFILALTYLTSGSVQVRGVSVGACLVVLHWLGLYVTGASYNPAYSFSTGFVAGELHQLWLFMVAPALGGLGASLFSKLLEKDAFRRD
jgi:aquaporin Z